MNAFDIIGPVMVGPSSSHTAGAVKIGRTCRRILGENIKKAEINLYGSFLSTGKGHGTDVAIVAGLLGFSPDDERISKSIEIAKLQDIEINFGIANIKNAHPNTVIIKLFGIKGKSLEVRASSIGGGRISVDEIDGFKVKFSTEYPTLIVRNEDTPGLVASVSSIISENSLNIATFQLYRGNRGGTAVMIIECDGETPENIIEKIRNLNGILSVTYFSLV